MTSAINRLLGERIKQLREERGATPRQLSDALGWERTFIYRVESGRNPPSLRNLSALAEYFGLDEADLLTFPSLSARHRLMDMTRGMHVHTVLEMEEACQRILDEHRPVAQAPKVVRGAKR